MVTFLWPDIITLNITHFVSLFYKSIHAKFNEHNIYFFLKSIQNLNVVTTFYNVYLVCVWKKKVMVERWNEWISRFKSKYEMCCVGVTYIKYVHVVFHSDLENSFIQHKIQFSSPTNNWFLQLPIYIDHAQYK
jgi:hypothetical protein